MRLREFAPAGGGGSGDYLRALASAWYNGVFDTGSLPRGIKTQQDVERLLNRGIVCPDGKTRKLHIDYNSDFDGVEIYSDDYYEHGDESGELDSRTGQPWGPYDHMEFKDEELDEGVAEGSLNEFAPDSNDGGEDDALHKYARMWWAGDEATQMQIERALAKMGWEIGEDEGSYDNGGVFVVRAGDINGNSYVSWPAEELTEGVAEGTDKYAELSKKIRDLAQAGKEGEANKLRYELNRLLMLDRDKKRRQQQGVAEGSEKHECSHCNGSGRMVRDPDIGTDQECFVCDGTGYVDDKQSVAEGKEELHTQLQSINQKLKLMRGGPVGEPNSMAFVEKRKELLKQKEQILSQLKQGVAEGFQPVVPVKSRSQGSVSPEQQKDIDRDVKLLNKYRSKGMSAGSAADRLAKFKHKHMEERGMAEGNNPWGPEGRFVGDTGPTQVSTIVPRVQLRIGDRVLYKPTEQRATIEALSKDGTKARIHIPSPMGGRTFNCRTADLKALGALKEKSTSQAQFRTMAAAAHDPKFAKKVGIKQSVAREFNKADKGQSYKSLPKKAD